MQGEINVTIPIDSGIAGACVKSKQIINLEDAYKVCPE